MTNIIRWSPSAASHEVDDDGITIHAGPLTDWFNDPRTDGRTASAPVAVVVEGALPVTVSCIVDIEPQATFDAACLVAHQDDDHWVKLALELDPSGQLRIVSVATDGSSDDCNHVAVSGTSCDLRISIDEHSVALHARSGDGGWELVRYCATPFSAPPSIGLEAQSPTGDGITARFTDITITHAAITELRDGT